MVQGKQNVIISASKWQGFSLSWWSADGLPLIMLKLSLYSICSTFPVYEGIQWRIGECMVFATFPTYSYFFSSVLYICQINVLKA